ncbi:hypothetical protein [Sorangium sp. So ce887]|uniref:hypothetical protein n=1 Tax=Sorangium sp. So ce887 TaxID=3133324 RepID=UPI003F644242
MRIVLSNAFGADAVDVGAATIGLAGASADAAVTDLRKLTFGGKADIRIAPGANAISDAVDLQIAPLARLAVSLFLPRDTPISTLHWHAGDVSVIGPGNQTTATQLNVENTTTGRLFLSQLLVDTQSHGTVVTIGDSITDNTGSGQGRGPHGR